MAVKVNRPPEIEMPKALKDLGISVINYFEELNRYNLQMFTRSGGATDLVDEAATNFNINLSSQVAQLRRELDGLPEFTIDTTGFTFDSTELTFDKVIA